MSRPIVLMIIAALSGGGAVAHAEESAVVSSKGLDLNNPADAKAFYERISRAAETVCARLTERMTTESDTFLHCYNVALDDAVARAHAPQVKAIKSKN